MSSKDRILDPDGDLFLILRDRGRGIKPDNTCMDDENDTSERKIRVQCSSKHLTLASVVLKAMLSEKFKEGADLRSNGTLTIPLPDDDPAALLILLNVIHGQNKEIPLEVDLCMLTRIAILVDKYRLHRVAKLISIIWIGAMGAKKALEDIHQWSIGLDAKKSLQDLRRWILISWVFKSPTEFKLATKIAQCAMTSTINEFEEIDLPIPCSIGDTIDQDRQSALSEIITALHGVVEKFSAYQEELYIEM